MAIIPYSQIVGKSFAPDVSLFEAAANETRRALCSREQIGTAVLDTGISLGGPLAAMREGLLNHICNQPGEIIPRPSQPLAPSNEGSCSCQRYIVRTRTTLPSGDSFPDSESLLYGPIGTFEDRDPAGTNARRQGLTSRGDIGGPCLPTIVKTVLNVGHQEGQKFSIVSISPWNPGAFPPVTCERPTFPAPRPQVDGEKPYPTINFPVPNAPSIPIPIIPVPVVIPVGAIIAPKLSFDLGGLNLEFSLGGVEINFNNSNSSSPITVAPPAFKQPSLPPQVTPIAPKEGEDCCDELLLGQQNIKDKLDDIEDCVCPPESEQLEAFTEVQTFTKNTGTKRIAFVQIGMLFVDDGKSFNVPGGKEVCISGWYAFGRDGRMGERKTLQYRQNLCVPPGKGYNEFTFSVYNGLLASGTIHTEKESE